MITSIFTSNIDHAILAPKEAPPPPPKKKMKVAFHQLLLIDLLGRQHKF